MREGVAGRTRALQGALGGESSSRSRQRRTPGTDAGWCCVERPWGQVGQTGVILELLGCKEIRNQRSRETYFKGPWEEMEEFRTLCRQRLGPSASPTPANLDSQT